MTQAPTVLRVVHRCTAWLFSFGFCCSKVAMAMLGPVLVTMAVLVIAFTVFVYFSHTYPALMSPQHWNLSPAMANLITAFGLYLLLLTLFHYLSTMLTPPGSPPPTSHWTPAMLAVLANDPDIHTKSSSYRHCHHCDVIKPMRCHHCSICRRCVLKMDHHCPWVNNCVGYRNYRHFALFCLYLCLVAVFFIVSSADVVVAVLTGRLGDDDWRLLVASICSLSGCIAAAIFTVWNLFLTLSNQSTIEFYGALFDGSLSDNPFNMGWRQNLWQVYGPTAWRNLLLPVHEEPPGDGLLFPMNRGRGHPMPQHINGDALPV